MRTKNCSFWENSQKIRGSGGQVYVCMYVIITCKYEKDPIKNNREKAVTAFSNYNTICYHGNQWSDLAEFRTHPGFYACPHCLQV